LKCFLVASNNAIGPVFPLSGIGVAAMYLAKCLVNFVKQRSFRWRGQENAMDEYAAEENSG